MEENVIQAVAQRQVTLPLLGVLRGQALGQCMPLSGG
jgi:hypothetical protein